MIIVVKKLTVALSLLKSSMTVYVHNLSIQIKLAFFLMLIFVIMITSVAILSFNKSSEIINRQSLLYSDMLLRQIADRVEKLKSDTVYASVPILINPNIQKNDYDRLDHIDFISRKKHIFLCLSINILPSARFAALVPSSQFPVLSKHSKSTL